MILISQVEKLILAGCKPRIKDTVKQLWLYFIQVAGYARIDHDTATKKKHLDFGTVRDEFFRSKYDKNFAGEKLTPCKNLKESESYLKLRVAKKLREVNQKTIKETMTT